MTDRFPHLRDTPFPNFSTVDPYRRKVDFDYGRYDYEASVKLCNVPWPFDYRHVVNWADEQARDAYMASIDGRTVELSQGFVRTQLDRVTVNVPYDVALTYNYVYMKVPTLTQDELIEHETQGIRTVCAFISECVYQAPSTTLLVLDVDVWTTYLPHLSTSAVMLERGHAPMYKTTASEYLTDPITRCADLLTPDVDFAGSDITRGGKFVPLSTSQLVYVIASPIPHDQLLSITQATSQSDTPATYYDLSARNGYQVGVSGYTWPSDGKSYAGMSIPSSVTRAEGSAPTGLYYYGIYAEDVNTGGALETIADLLPVFVTSAVAAYVVPSNLIGMSTQYQLGGVTIYKVTSEYRLQGGPTFTLNKSLFGYPERYADIAKLYTFPYAHLQISDDLGNDITLHVEDCHGTIESMQALSIIWPTLSWEVALTNVASLTGDVTYTWRKLNASAESHALPGADFMSFLMSYDIPTYALRLTAKREAALGGYVDAQARRESAIVSYQSAMRSANTGLENALASNATAKTNSDASADTALTNVQNTGLAQITNTATQNNARTAITGYQNTNRTNVAFASGDGVLNTIFSLGEADVEYDMYATDAQLKADSIGGAMNTIGSLASGNVVGAITGGVASIISITTSQAIAELSETNIEQKVGVNQDHTTLVTNEANTLATNTTAKNNETTTSVNTVNVNLANTNAGNTNTTTKANSARTKSTGDANATYSRGTSEENAKTALSLAKDVYEASIANAGLQPPVMHGLYSGDMRGDAYQRRGLHLRAVTQSDGALSRTADAFLRYGYQYSGIWEITSWCPAGHDFCYWQASDLWQNIRDIANPTAERVYESMLTMGVTVWNDPEKIGRVRI